jgi:hypothetical protein
MHEVDASAAAIHVELGSVYLNQERREVDHLQVYMCGRYLANVDVGGFTTWCQIAVHKVCESFRSVIALEKEGWKIPDQPLGYAVDGY